MIEIRSQSFLYILRTASNLLPEENFIAQFLNTLGPLQTFVNGMPWPSPLLVKDMLFCYTSRMFGEISEKIRKFSITTFAWSYIALITLLTNLLTLFSVLAFGIWDPQRKIAHKVIIHFWGNMIGRANPFWRLHLEGTKQIDRKRSYVIICNHTSMADIICVYNLNLQFKWIAKESLFQVPFLGWSMTLAKYIPLERGKTGSIRKSYEKAKWWLSQNMSVLIFPEGTRSKDGSLGDFKNGAFKLAIECQKPILPVVLRGNEKVIAKGKSTISGRTETFLKVLPPVETLGLGPKDFQTLKKKIHDSYKLETASQKKNS